MASLQIMLSPSSFVKNCAKTEVTVADSGGVSFGMHKVYVLRDASATTECAAVAMHDKGSPKKKPRAREWLGCQAGIAAEPESSKSSYLSGRIHVTNFGRFDGVPGLG
jgi:hypothetical protein